MADKAEKEQKSEKAEQVAEAAKSNPGFDLTRFNTLSIVSVATSASAFGAVAGIITGHVALSQIKRTGERGAGLALTGVILGYGYLALGFGSMIVGAVLRMRGIEYGQGQMHGNLPQDMHGGFGMGRDDFSGQGMMGHNDGGRGFGPDQNGPMGGQMGQFNVVPSQPDMNGQLPPGQPGIPGAANN